MLVKTNRHKKMFVYKSGKVTWKFFNITQRRTF